MKYCEEFAALLDPYVDGELSAQEAARVRSHLETCPGCRRYVDEALAIRAAFPGVEDTAVPEDFTAGVMAAVREAAEKRTAGRRRIYWRKVLLPLAACFALVVLLRTIPGAGSGAPADAPAAMDDTAVAYGAAENGIAAYDAGEEPAAPYSPAAAPQMTAGGGDLPAEADNALPQEEANAPADPEPLQSPGGAAKAGREIPAPTALQADEEWVNYGNVVFSAVVYLDSDDVGDALEGFEGKPYSNANLPEEGVIGTGYAMDQADFERILYDVLDYPLGPMLNQDRTTELCCIVVKNP